MKAVIFDLDGVIVDNDNYHQKAFFKLCASYNMDLTEEDYRKKVIGGTNEAIMVKLFGELSTQEIEKRAIEKESIYRELYRPFIKPLPGLLALLDGLFKHDIPCAIGSNAPLENIDFVLETLKIRKYFIFVSHPGLGIKGKPDPAIFIKAAESLSVAPKDCIVFDDSKTGIQAGLAAGMKTIGVLTTHQTSELPPCSLYIKDFQETTFQILNKL